MAKNQAATIAVAIVLALLSVEADLPDARQLFQLARVAQFDDPLVQSDEIRRADHDAVKVHVAEKPLLEFDCLVKLVKQPGVGVFQPGMSRVDVEQPAEDLLRRGVREHVVDLVAARYRELIKLNQSVIILIYSTLSFFQVT